ncbi:PepSY-associated TM helix domain-containing protein [Galbibacter orientalis]|uniref:PepSY-associated TM helix domain-containing protein n=1 Tax=Galbibacter orientalis TaxID=453852 RepID=UPI0030808F5D
MKSVKKKKTKSIFRIINDEIHLWLGLISGIIVFIVSITGCFYAFEREIKDAIEPWRFVEQENKLFVPPSVLIDTAAVYMDLLYLTGQ